MIAADIARAIDPVRFAVDCGVDADPWQASLLTEQPRRALLNCSRQSGKSTVTGLVALHRALYEPAALIVLVSPSQRQSAELLRTVKGLYTRLAGADAPVSESVLKLEFGNGSRILALPGTERTIRGMAGVSLVVVDEAARCDDELLQAVRPMLATRSDGGLILLSTPAGRRGFFFDLWHNADPIWTRVRVPASECPRISKEFLAEELKALGPMRFSEEYELQFVDDDTQAFPSGVIERAFTKDVMPLWA